METTGEALFRTILENPHDDAPRLIYADWLEENGEEERAEFIRVQCELAQNPSDVLRWRQFEIVFPTKSGRVKHGMDWFGDELVLKFDDYKGDNCRIVRRGFVDEIRCTLNLWLDKGPTIVCEHPVTRVVLNNVSLYHNALWCESGNHTANRVAAGCMGILPKKLYSHLKTRSKWGMYAVYHHSYTPTDWRDDLSQACIAWSKEPIAIGEGKA